MGRRLCSTTGKKTLLSNFDALHFQRGAELLSQLILNEISEQQKAIDGLEELSKILARYSAVEKLFGARKAQEQDHDFEQSIVDLYIAILRFQATAAYHFGRKTFPRMVANITTSNDWSGMLQKVQVADENCKALIAIKSTQVLLKRIQRIPQGFDRELYLKWQEQKSQSDEILRQWIDNRIKASESQQEENETIVNWISDVKVGQDHSAVREKLGSIYWDSGQWLLSPLEDEVNHFEMWKLSQRGQFWLRGSVGTGKSSITSIVIDHIIQHDQQDRLAFFYCSRNSSANTPLSILRSLVSQLVWSPDGLAISDYVTKLHKKQTARRNLESRFSISDCVDLLIALINLYGSTVIVIDGLDECEGPMELLWKLLEVWEKSKYLKVFVSSREGIEVSKVFPEAVVIRTESEKSSSDVMKYITQELSRKERRNRAVVTDELARRMVAVLTQLSDGMFRWVELQLDLFISAERPIRHWKDFEARLQKLELEQASGREVVDRLGETYEEIFQRNVQGEFSQKLAVRALQWVLCAFRPFELPELREAIAIEDTDVTEALLLDLCSNFIQVDSAGLVRLAHISVKEYLELKKFDGQLKFSPSQAHTQATVTCFQYWGSPIEKTQPPSPPTSNTPLQVSFVPEREKNPLPHVLVRDAGVRGKLITPACTTDTAEERGDPHVIHTANLSWRSYAALYWANHYRIATRHSFLDESSCINLRKELVSFLDGHHENASLERWLGEMAKLRYAFRQRGAGLGDRTCSPVGASHRSPSTSWSTFRAPAPTLSSVLAKPSHNATERLYEKRLLWTNDDFEPSDYGADDEIPKAAPSRRSPSVAALAMHNFSAVPRPGITYPPISGIQAEPARNAPQSNSTNDSIPHLGTSISRHQKYGPENRTVYDASISQRQKYGLEDRTVYDTFSGWSLPSQFPVARVDLQLPDRPKKEQERLWLSDSSYSKDKSMFWDEWKDVSSFPFDGLEVGRRRIVFLTACCFGFEHILRSVCNVERCKAYRNHNGLSGLHLAARYGYVSIVGWLIENGMKDDYEAEAGTTALQEACSAGALTVVERLLQVKSQNNFHYINIEDSRRRSPLHLAAENNHSDIIALLLRQPGIDVNAQDRDLATPLHAAWRYSVKSLHLLLADPRINTGIRDIFGKTYEKQ